MRARRDPTEPHAPNERANRRTAQGARPARARLIEAEEAGEAVFRAGALDDERLRSLIAEAEAARESRRFIHLSRHLSTLYLLSADQISHYNTLRAYGSDHP